MPQSASTQNVTLANSSCTVGNTSGVGSTLTAPSPLPNAPSPIGFERPETGVDSLIEGTPSEFGASEIRDDLYEETASIITTNSEEEVQLQVKIDILKNA